MKFYNKKIVFFIFILTLAIGVTMYSTAFLKNFNKLTSNLKFHTGTLKLNIDDEGKWILQNKNKSEVTNKDNNNDFNNVKIGDNFVKKVLITNNGTLKQKLSMKVNNNIPIVSKYFNIELISPELIFLKPNETRELNLKMELKTLDDKSKNQTIDLSKVNTNNLITINAIQTSWSVDVIKLRGEQRFKVFTDSLFINLDHREKKFLVTATDDISHYNYDVEFIKFNLMDKNGKTKLYCSLRGDQKCTDLIEKLNKKSFEVGDLLKISCPRPENVFISIGGKDYTQLKWSGTSTYEITEDSLNLKG